MCNSCATNWGICACDGGEVFGMCPCSKGYECSVCGHYPLKLIHTEEVTSVLKDLIRPEILQKSIAEYNLRQQAPPNT
jgi:hypothetical protein